jgi:hypothetical protein
MDLQIFGKYLQYMHTSFVDWDHRKAAGYDFWWRKYFARACGWDIGSRFKIRWPSTRFGSCDGILNAGHCRMEIQRTERSGIFRPGVWLYQRWL